MRHTIHVLRPAVVAGLLLGWSPAASWAQAQGETFMATASLKTRGGSSGDGAGDDCRHPADDRQGTRRDRRCAEEGRDAGGGAVAQGDA